MRAGTAPSGTVRVVGAAATHKGVSRPINSVSVGRNLPSDLPDSVAGGSGITAATGTVEWAQTTAIKPRDDNPWKAGTAPQPGDRVNVDMNSGAGTHRVFTGAVQTSSGGTRKAMKSSLMDDLFRFNTKVTIPPLVRIMPPRVEGEEFRRIGLTYAYHVNVALRACGFYLTPQGEPNTALSVPMQGSTLPEYGTLDTSGTPSGSPNFYPSFYGGGDGRLYAAEVEASYLPRLQHPATHPVQISLNVGADHSDDTNGFTDVTATYGANFIRLRVNIHGHAAAFWNGTLVTTLNNVRGLRVSLLVQGSTWEIKASDERIATGVQATSGTTEMGRVTISGRPSSRVAGVIVSHPEVPASLHASLNRPQNAFFRPGSISYGHLRATPSIMNRTALDLLMEISKATISSMWLDEDGNFQWAGPGVLRNQSPAVTVTPKQSLLNLDWKVSLDQSRYRTSVSWKQPQVTVGRWPRVTLHEGARESLYPLDETQEFISVPDDEDWIQVSLPALYAGQPTGGDERFNRGLDTWVGGYPVDPSDGGPAGGWFTPAHGSASISRLGYDTYLYEMRVGSTIPNGGEYFATEMNPASVGLWNRWLGQTLPLIRGFGRITWADESWTSSIVGDAGRPDLNHDMGPWGSDNSDQSDDPGFVPTPQRTANWLAEQVAIPLPEVSGMAILPDSRVQLGDVVGVNDPDNLGVVLTGLIVEANLAQTGSANQTHSLGVRVISANPTHVTYAEFEAAWAGADYAALEAAWAGKTYADLEDDPLLGAPNA